MSETANENYKNNSNICRTCLRVGGNVRAMVFNEINILRCLLPDLTIKEPDLAVCLFCSWVIKKIIKFQSQCVYASQTLELIKQNTNTRDDIHCLTYSHDFTTTIQTESVQSDDDDFKTDDAFNDELPLIMLKQDDDGEFLIKETELTLEEEQMKVRNGRKKKRKKINTYKEIEPNGLFSKRMVQETNEYVVIKLSREQVLEEMAQKAMTDKYIRALYKCERCVKGYNFEDVLQKHLDKHSMKNGPFKCDICSQYCPSAISLRGHMKSHTSRYKCKICGCVKISRQHQLEHFSICHTPDDIPRYTCDECTFTTDKRTVMQRHVRTHNVKDKHPCHQCGKLFKNLETLRVHTTRHDKSKLLRCEFCNKNFLYPSLLQKHVRSVHVLKEYYCVECDVKFKSLDNMRTHFKKTKKHRDPTVISNQSTGVYGATQTLRDALRSPTHDAACKAKCELCGTKFARKSSLAVHMRLHKASVDTPATVVPSTNKTK